MQLEQIQGEVITSSLAFTKIRVDSQKIAKLNSSTAKQCTKMLTRRGFFFNVVKNIIFENHGSVVALLPDLTFVYLIS